MVCLRLPNDQVTTDPAEMRRLAMEFYDNLFSKDTCYEAVVAELLQGLPQLTSEDQETKHGLDIGGAYTGGYTDGI